MMMLTSSTPSDWMVLITILLTITTTLAKDCTTKVCREIAAEMQKGMNTSVKACDDYYHHMCGTFVSTAGEVPGDQLFIGPFNDLILSAGKLHKDLLSKSVQRPGPNSFEQKMKEYYKLCLDTDHLDRHGMNHYSSSCEFSEWPSINPNWNTQTYQWYTEKYERLHYTQALFGYNLWTDKYGTEERYLLNIYQPELPLFKFQLTQARNSTAITAYEKYYADVAVHLGAEQNVATQDATELMDFYIEMAKIMLANYEYIPKLTDNPQALYDMHQKYPYLDWQKIVQGMYPGQKITLTQRVNVMPLAYFEKLGDVLKNTSSRVIANHFGMKHAHPLISDVTKKMRDLDTEFQKKLYPSYKRTAKDTACVEHVEKIFNRGLARIVADLKLGTTGRKQFKEIITNIKLSSERMLRANTWLSSDSRAKAIQKVKTMAEWIGIPDVKMDVPDIDDYYKRFKVTGKDFYLNREHLVRELKRTEMSTLNELFQYWLWPVSMTATNAYYAPSSNSMIYCLGMLEPPFYHKDYPRYMNYAGFGYLVGHELSHGYDKSGSEYDHRGRLSSWWKPEEKKRFEKNVACLEKQYDTFCPSEVPFCINGTQTNTENTADNIAVQLAFSAYQEAKKDGAVDPLLPGLGLNQDELFFATYARIFCSKFSLKELESLIMQRPHSPLEFRAIGTLQNSEDFSKTFSCRDGDYMNRKPKCKIY